MPKPTNLPSDLDHQSVAKFYDEVYYRDASGAAKPSGHLRRLAKRLGIRQGEKLLDIACGTGEWLSVASAAGLAVAGIDISARAIEVCRERMPGGVFEVGPAERLPFDDAGFDIVTCLGSLEHFLDQPKALSEMRRVVKPDGRVLILVPNAGFLTHRLGLYRGTHQQAVRETIRSLDVWADMFEVAGLQVQNRWRDLHILEYGWIVRRPWLWILPRLMQALALAVWPLDWQYQVFHLCKPEKSDGRLANSGLSRSTAKNA